MTPRREKIVGNIIQGDGIMGTFLSAICPLKLIVFPSTISSI